MVKDLIKGLLFVFACVIATCLVSTMVLFMGGDQLGADLKVLTNLQAASIPLGLATVALLIFAAGRNAAAGRIKKIYAATPQWLIFGAIVLNLVVISGETALIVVSRAIDGEIAWTSHVPLISMMTSSVALCVLVGQNRLLSGHTQSLSGRWAP
ncbi:MAG: hypothetical protein QNJ11_01835 [Woeseiaceae bacterium]|nr:hypothetical protein [Woeseiaceae bacterium]